MFDKDSHVIRGYSEREVELKVQTFIAKRRRNLGEDWEAEDVEYRPSRTLFYKPYSCVLRKDS